jgi:hypothetical protein
LSEAEDIFVVGYSLPETDAFFRYLYALGTANRDKVLRRFWVFNPKEEGGEVDMRFKALLGPGAQQRYKYYAVTFEDSISIIQKQFPERT